MKFEVNIDKRYAYLILSVVIISAGILAVGAYRANGVGGNPAVMGHSVDEINWSQTISSVKITNLNVTTINNQPAGSGGSGDVWWPYAASYNVYVPGTVPIFNESAYLYPSSMIEHDDYGIWHNYIYAFPPLTKSGSLNVNYIAYSPGSTGCAGTVRVSLNNVTVNDTFYYSSVSPNVRVNNVEPGDIISISVIGHNWCGVDTSNFRLLADRTFYAPPFP